MFYFLRRDSDLNFARNFCATDFYYTKYMSACQVCFDLEFVITNFLDQISKIKIVFSMKPLFVSLQTLNETSFECLIPEYNHVILRNILIFYRVLKNKFCGST
jgi:hypothetical protein